ncbi:MAG: OmpW family outer membrane protein [Pseudomonadota bacterium]
MASTSPKTQIIPKTLLASAISVLLMNAPTVANADAGDLMFRVGGSIVAPQDDNGLGLDVDDGYSLTFTGSYFITDQFAIELLAAWPFTHDIAAEGGGGDIAETKHLPPTLSAQWHFIPDGKFRPYIGAGLNYTLFFDEEIDGADLSLDRSFGFAAQVGVDIELTESMFLNFDLRYIDIATDAKVNGTQIGEVEIDPLIFGVHVGWRFGSN